LKDESRPVCLALHGYQDTSKRLFDALLGELNQSVEILAPNAPFPTPIQTERGWKDAYAWYFYDVQTHRALVHPTVAVETLVEVLDQTGCLDRPLLLFGFSQGAYLATFLAAHPRLRRVEHVVALGAAPESQYWVPGYAGPISVAIGTDDTVFSSSKGETETANINRARGNEFAQMACVEGEGHRVTPRFVSSAFALARANGLDSKWLRQS
jgi:predicted esterase